MFFFGDIFLNFNNVNIEKDFHNDFSYHGSPKIKKSLAKGIALFNFI
jgi:hypothetical protein